MRGSIVDPRGRRKTWSVVIPVGKDPQTGRLRQQWKGGFKTKRDAEAYLNEVLPDVQNGTWMPPSKERFKAFAQRWLKDYVAATARPTTLASYEMIARKHLIPELGLIPLAQLSPKRIQQYFTGKLESGLSSTTVRHHAMLLHRLLVAAVREGILSQNPADRVEVPRSRAVEIQTLDVERARLFLAAAQRNSSLYPLYFAALFLGLRMGELLGLAWKHVSFALARASVVQIVYWLYGSTKEGRSTQLLFKEPKSRQSRREVSLPPLLVEELRRLREAQKENRRLLSDRYHDYDLVFCQANGKPLHPSDVRKDFHRILKAAGLPRIRFHDLRHSCATLRLAAGDNLKVVQELLGHASAAFTLSVYGHVVPGLREQSTRALEARLLGEKPEVHEQS
jgi:integrase